MATAAVSQTKHPERARQRDRLFFPGIALLVLSAVLVGFARTYFLAGVFWANLANAMVHVHGALFTLWIALLVTQVALVASHRTGWHMRLGIAGMFLAPLMVITGFAFLISWAFLARRDAPTHKRLVLCATFLIIVPAIARWPIVGNVAQNPMPFYLCVNSFPALLVAYDLWTRRSLHRATIWGVALMIALQLAVLPLARTALIGHTIAWLQRT